MAAKSTKLKRRRSATDDWQIYVLLAPFMLLFIVFVVFPVIGSFAVSFTQYNVLEAPQFTGLANYRRMFVDDPVFMKALSNTFIFAIITGPLGYILTFFASWAINELGRYTKAIITFIFYIPSISGTVFTVWALIFDSDIYGYANSFLMRFGLIDDPIAWFTDERYILTLIIIVQLWMSMGVGFLAMRAGFSATDSQYYEAGAIDGIKNRWQELWYITIPMMVPHMMTAAVLQVTAMFANAAVSQTLAGSPSTNYAGHLLMNHFNDFSTLRMERGYASAIAVLLFVFMVGINRLVIRLLRKVGK